MTPIYGYDRYNGRTVADKTALNGLPGEGPGAHRGRELFFRDGVLNFVSVPIRPGASFSMGEPRVLFASKDFVESPVYHVYDVAPGDNRFLFARNTASAQGAAPVTLVLIEQWFAELRQGGAGPRE
jgi:hypothetical protein